MKFLILVVLMASWGMGIGQSRCPSHCYIWPQGSENNWDPSRILSLANTESYFRVFKGRMALDKDSGEGPIGLFGNRSP